MSPPPSLNLRALAFGAVAISFWATMASLITLTGAVPPFQLTAITFAIGAASGLAIILAKGGTLRAAFNAPPGAVILGLAGLLGYHVLYFSALQNAPPLEANVINYLWPLLIVLFSALLPASAGGKRLGWHHIAGALIGFTGAVIAIGIYPSGSTTGLNVGAGHLAALGGAFTWAAYSVASRLFKGVPSTSIVGICVLTAIGAGLIHLAVESTAWPLSPLQWALVIAMGLGPAGLAFTLWDEAVKHGDLRLIGVISYATPLMSNGLLAALGLGSAGPSLWVAVLLVTGGALLAAKDTFRLSSRAPVV